MTDNIFLHGDGGLARSEEMLLTIHSPLPTESGQILKHKELVARQKSRLQFVSNHQKVFAYCDKVDEHRQHSKLIEAKILQGALSMSGKL